MQENGDNLALYELARKIASKKAGGRYYREDVVSDAYLAVADGANSQRDIENAVRRSLRSEWAQEDGHLSVEDMDIFSWESAPEWARPDLSGAIEALPPDERYLVILKFWEDRTQEEIARKLGYSQRQVGRILKGALTALRAFLSGANKTTPQKAATKRRRKSSRRNSSVRNRRNHESLRPAKSVSRHLPLTAYAS